MNKPAAYDLHLHTLYSYDAIMEPRVYFEAAMDLQLRAFAITDHHGFDVRFELQELIAEYPDVRAIPAAEFSMGTSLGSVDMICLNLPFELPEDLEDILKRYRAYMHDYGAGICRGMQAQGFDYTLSEHEALLASYRPERARAQQGVTRVKNQLLREHFISRGLIRDEAGYRQLMGNIRNEGYVPVLPNAEEVVPVVQAAGGLVSLAHPHGYFQGADRERMDILRRECRLDGIECAHNKIPPEFTPVYRAYCEEHGLLSTAGSDTHMPEDMENLFGQYPGEECWLDEILERMA